MIIGNPKIVYVFINGVEKAWKPLVLRKEG